MEFTFVQFRDRLYGITPDFILCDELTHWPTRDLWDSLISSAAKRPSCLVVVISNAGYGESWQWGVREAVRIDPDWHFSRLDGPQASWITPKLLAEQRRLLPDIAYRRLWLNEWTAGSGDALREDDIRAAVTQDGPLESRERGWLYVAGVDIGLSRDAAAVAVVGVDIGYGEPMPASQRPPASELRAILADAGLLDDAPIVDSAESTDTQYTYHQGTGRLKVASLMVWQPAKGQKVSLADVESWLLSANGQYGLSCVAFDPWQAAYLAQRLASQGLTTASVDPTPSNLKAMASCVMEAFSERSIDLFAHPRLLGDLRALRAEERQYGVRLVSPRGPSGHGDVASALAIALLTAKRHAPAGLLVNRPLLAYAE